jgi:hypothetical protein
MNALPGLIVGAILFGVLFVVIVAIGVARRVRGKKLMPRDRAGNE